MSILDYFSKSKTVGEKVVNLKSFGDVMGQKFLTIKLIGERNSFTKKYLKFSVKRFGENNLLFIICAQEFKKEPTLYNLAKIYDVFFDENSEYQTNFSSLTSNLVKSKLLALKNIAADPTRRRIPVAFRVDMSILDSAVFGTLTEELNNHFSSLKASPFDKVFVMNAEETKRYEKSISFLRDSFQVVLM